MDDALLFALSTGEQTFWWIAVGMGAVVVVVVAALLTLLHRLLGDVEQAALRMRAGTEELAAVTAEAWELDRAVHEAERLTEELATQRARLGHR